MTAAALTRLTPWTRLLLVLAFVGGTRLCAQSDAALLQTAFERLDSNRDGVLLRKEFPGSDAQYAAIDKDRDGKATFAEYQGSPVAAALLRARYKEQAEPRPRTTADSLALLRLAFLSRADANRDGRVTREEWTGAKDAFAQLDLDGNNVLDKRDEAEARAQAPPPPPALPEIKSELQEPKELLARFDKDGDGKLSAKELAAHKSLAAALPFADGDGDGALSLAELESIYYALQRRRMEQQGGGSGRPEPYEVPFDVWDTDKDGRVRQNEWMGPRELFDRIDLDRDAAVSRDEVRRYELRVRGEDFVGRFDLDGDGRVTPAEFGGPTGAFRRADRNGDGVITRGDRGQ